MIYIGYYPNDTGWRLILIPDATIVGADRALVVSVRITAVYVSIGFYKTRADDLIHFELFHAERWGCVDFLFHCACYDFNDDFIVGVVF